METEVALDDGKTRAPSDLDRVFKTQELNYRFVMQAIADLGFTGFVSHEYSPTQGHDPIAELTRAIAICDV